MSENIIQMQGRTIIMNGGDPLSGCPTSWDEAYKWEDVANEEKSEYEEPRWRFDCGLKLDYDGPLLSVSSRFYPPKTHYGPKWDGTVTIYLMGKVIEEKEFECATIDILKEEVETYIKLFVAGLEKVLGGPR